ncbi:hypothetical protein HWV62_39672 [Athelia sp. TMB]|nr:hypothetical protein HWV62_39672 [Athelia sp. TMB]
MSTRTPRTDPPLPSPSSQVHVRGTTSQQRERQVQQRARELENTAQMLAARLREHNDREHDLQQRSDDLDARETHIQEREERALDEREAAIRRQQDKLEEREEMVAMRESEIEANLLGDFRALNINAVASASSATISSESSFTEDALYEDEEERSDEEERPATPVRVENEDNRRYLVNAPSVSGLVHTWVTAGNATLSHRGAYAKRTTRLPKREHAPYTVFVVMRGYRLGVFQARWGKVEPFVKGVSGAIFKGYYERETATLDYHIACDLRFVVEVARPDDLAPLPDEPRSLVPVNPTQHRINEVIRTTHIPLGAPWYAVFKGLRTGVFPFWQAVIFFLASTLLPSQRSIASSLTRGLPLNTHQRYSSRQAAVEAYDAAVRADEIEELEGGRPYIFGAQ